MAIYKVCVAEDTCWWAVSILDRFDISGSVDSDMYQRTYGWLEVFNKDVPAPFQHSNQGLGDSCTSLPWDERYSHSSFGVKNCSLRRQCIFFPYKIRWNPWWSWRGCYVYFLKFQDIRLTIRNLSLWILVLLNKNHYPLTSFHRYSSIPPPTHSCTPAQWKPLAQVQTGPPLLPYNSTD